MEEKDDVGNFRRQRYNQIPVGKDRFYWLIRSNTTRGIRSDVTNEVDKRKDLKAKWNEVDVCVLLSLGFSLCFLCAYWSLLIADRSSIPWSPDFDTGLVRGGALSDLDLSFLTGLVITFISDLIRLPSLRFLASPLCGLSRPLTKLGCTDFGSNNNKSTIITCANVVLNRKHY